MQVKYEVSYGCYGHHVNVDEPSECPLCKHSLKPTVLSKHMIDDNNGTPFLCVVYLCTHCYELFVCKFINLKRSTNFNHDLLFTSSTLSSKEPKCFNKRVFEECINKISPAFVKIYNQSLEAEHNALDEVAGIGYRKALEFLVKDFLIQHEHKDENKVKSTALGCCIDTMIESPQLKTVASRATWLGNDQTHYEQKYTDKDITDLKRLIDLTVHWISLICLTDEAELIEKK